MDLRYNYETIKREIKRADLGYIDANSLLAQDIKRRLLNDVDVIIGLEAKKKEIEEEILQRRLELKLEAEKWEI